MAGATNLLEARGLTKTFPGVKALDGVDFTLRCGEIHALLGENGAGKSTLINLLTGVLPCDSGAIRIEGRAVDPSGPAAAAAAGVGAVYQEIALLPNLTVAENLYLGRQPTRLGLVRRGRMNTDARALLARYGLDIDVTRSLGNYSTAVQQLVAIARAVDLSAKVLILDEPTASLDAREVETLFSVMRQLKAQGLGVVFVTHFLDQVYAIADRLTVLRNGQLVGERLTAELPKLELVSMMIGRSLEQDSHLARRTASAPGPVAVEISGLGKRRMVEPFNLAVRSGEVVGAAGLLGSGRTETALLMFGAARADTGEIKVGGELVRIRSPQDAIRHGFGFLPEERKTDGVVGALSIRENIVLALQAKRGWLKRLSRKAQDELAEGYIRKLDIRTPDADKPIGQLSGGNQQKALLARWLATEPRFLILDEPTRGIDVGAHAEIVRLLEDLREGGIALYVISSEIEEVAAYADRVMVMRDRKAAGVLEGEAVTPAAIIRAIAGEERAA
jgi:simple sugar transport system ATP-binding protein